MTKHSYKFNVLHDPKGFAKLDFKDGSDPLALTRWEAEEMYFMLGVLMQDADMEELVDENSIS